MKALLHWLKEKGRNKGSKKDNRGLSLIELLCAVAIFGMVAATAGGIMVVSARSYQRGASEADLQQIAQLAVNQIQNLVIDCTGLGTCAEGHSDCLTIVRDTSEYHVYLGTDSEGNNALMYQQYVGGTMSEAQVLAYYVTAFSADTSKFSEYGSIILSLALENTAASRTYAADFTVTSRNGNRSSGVPVFTDHATINSVPSELVLEPNEEFTFTGSVTGTLSDLSITKFQFNSTFSTADVTSSADGSYSVTIKIGQDETADTLYLYLATSAYNGEPTDINDRYAYEMIEIHIRRVTTLDLTGELTAGISCNAGSKYRLTATVSGTNLPRITGMQTDDTQYFPPYGVTWDYSLTTAGGATETGTFSSTGDGTYISWTVTDTTIGSVASITLKAEIKNLTVTATALHPEGTFGGTVTNKTGLPYGTVSNVWNLAPGGFKRGSWTKIDLLPYFTEDEIEKVENNNERYPRTIIDWYYQNNDSNGVWEYLTTQSTDADIIMTAAYLHVKSTENFRYVEAYLNYDKPVGSGNGLSYSNPYYVNGWDWGIDKVKGELNINWIAGRKYEFEYDIEDVIFRYRNSETEGWKDKQVIYITPDDAENYYTTYFDLVGGYDEDTASVAFNRYVGVVVTSNGIIDELRYDLRFDNNGTQYRNNAIPSQLNFDRISFMDGDNAAVRIYVTNEEAQDILNSYDGADGSQNGEVIIQEIFEYNPAYGTPSNNAKMRQVDGCEGILEYHVIKSNIVMSSDISGTKLDVMYCPGVDGYGTVQVGGEYYYYISNDTRYAIASNGLTAYYQTYSGSWQTNYWLYRPDANSKWLAFASAQSAPNYTGYDLTPDAQESSGDAGGSLRGTTWSAGNIVLAAGENKIYDLYTLIKYEAGDEITVSITLDKDIDFTFAVSKNAYGNEWFTSQSGNTTLEYSFVSQVDNFIVIDPWPNESVTITSIEVTNTTP